jgi:hypothetical protein
MNGNRLYGRTIMLYVRRKDLHSFVVLYVDTSLRLARNRSLSPQLCILSLLLSDITVTRNVLLSQGTVVLSLILFLNRTHSHSTCFAQHFCTLKAAGPVHWPLCCTCTSLRCEPGGRRTRLTWAMIKARYRSGRH